MHLFQQNSKAVSDNDESTSDASARSRTTYVQNPPRAITGTDSLNLERQRQQRRRTFRAISSVRRNDNVASIRAERREVGCRSLGSGARAGAEGVKKRKVGAGEGAGTGAGEGAGTGAGREQRAGGRRAGGTTTTACACVHEMPRIQ